jgi:hypothetical protein
MLISFAFLCFVQVAVSAVALPLLYNALDRIDMP